MGQDATYSECFLDDPSDSRVVCLDPTPSATWSCGVAADTCAHRCHNGWHRTRDASRSDRRRDQYRDHRSAHIRLELAGSAGLDSRFRREADGRFDPGDEILFFGQRFRGPEMDQKYTDERVYWLDIGGTAGPRIQDIDATPQGNLTPPTDFATTVRAEQSNLWWTLHCLCLDTQDTWFWDRLQPIGAGPGVTRTFPYTVPHPAPGFTATLRLEEISRVRSRGTSLRLASTMPFNDPDLGLETTQGIHGNGAIGLDDQRCKHLDCRRTESARHSSGLQPQPRCPSRCPRTIGWRRPTATPCAP